MKNIIDRNTIQEMTDNALSMIMGEREALEALQTSAWNDDDEEMLKWAKSRIKTMDTVRDWFIKVGLVKAKRDLEAAIKNAKNAGNEDREKELQDIFDILF